MNDIYSDYSTIIRSVGDKLIQSYIKTECVNTGINGPYDDPETEVRNLSHLIVITAIEYLVFSNSSCLSLVKNMAERLMTMKGEDGTYKMRQKQGKDLCNGVIGHAWLNEGYIYAFKATGDKRYLEEAVRICKMHLFQPKLGLWGRPNKGNANAAIDFTFNHQLWYAAMLGEVLQYYFVDELKAELDTFFKRLNQNMIVNSQGRIAHHIFRRLGLKESVRMFIKHKKIALLETMNKPGFMYKEIGYHVFNLMAFSRLYNLYSSKPFFHSGKFLRTLKFVESEEYQSWLLSADIKMDGSTFGKSLTREEEMINIYGYPYNVPGFELVYCLASFNGLIDSKAVETILKNQFEQTWNRELGLFGDKCHDATTINYRIYEYYRYLERI